MPTTAHWRTRRFNGAGMAITIGLLALAAAAGATYFGLRGGSGRSASRVVTSGPTISPVAPTPAQSEADAPPTTVPVTTTASAARRVTAVRTAVPIPGGTFVTVGGTVSLTHVVMRGDTLFGIAKWYELMGGTRALYRWNHSTVGRDPNLLYRGEVLTITVPGKDIPTISPVWLAEAKRRG